MSETPPPYADYPRNTPTYGTASHLQNLADGYFGLNWVFLLNVVLAIAWRVSGLFLPDLSLPLALVLGAVVGTMAHPQNRKIGFGANWPPSRAIVASVLMGLNSAFCCGIVGFIVMQTIAMNHMKKYGLKSGFLGIRKRDVERRVNELSETTR